MPSRYEEIVATCPLHVQRIIERTYGPAGTWSYVDEETKNAGIKEYLAEPSDGISEILDGLFNFEESPEGFAYWDALGAADREARRAARRANVPQVCA